MACLYSMSMTNKKKNYQLVDISNILNASQLPLVRIIGKFMKINF